MPEEPKRTKLTKRSVDAAKAPARGEVRIWDTEQPGFALRVRASGARSFIVQCRIAGRSRTITLGKYPGKLTVDQARDLARQRLAAAARGEDPVREKRAAELRAETFAELVNGRGEPGERDRRIGWLEMYRAQRRSDRARSEVERIVGLLAKRFGSRPWRSISRSEVLAYHVDLRSTPREANNRVARLAAILNYGDALERDPEWTNPARFKSKRHPSGIAKYPETHRKRFLSEHELARIGAALRELEQAGGVSTAAAAAIRLLLLTGCRLREITTLRWREVDLAGGYLRLSTSKTGAKDVPLGAPALKLLSELPRVSPYVIPGGRKGKPLANLWRPWAAVCKAAKVEGCRPHDLRHSFASAGARAGGSPQLVAALLGHRSIASTYRYTHHSDDAVKAHADAIAGSVAAALGESEPAPVVAIAGARRRRRSE